jgi:hypothetical protein
MVLRQPLPRCGFLLKNTVCDSVLIFSGGSLFSRMMTCRFLSAVRYPHQLQSLFAGDALIPGSHLSTQVGEARLRILPSVFQTEPTRSIARQAYLGELICDARLWSTIAKSPDFLAKRQQAWVRPRDLCALLLSLRGTWVVKPTSLTDGFTIAASPVWSRQFCPR